MGMTAKATLVNDRLAAKGNDLARFIRAGRANGDSWEDIARDLRNATDVDMTGESVRAWASQLQITSTTP